MLNGIGYYQQQFNDKTNKSSFEIITIQDRLPVRRTLSFFKDKHNNDKTKEAEMNKKHPSGW
ncbi:hypothetical protein ['Fragaria x ananassa' phyllody phytoplasma]|uniref:hypothetical protein n=1 Tax='Fragaria x ananassa' phyllody phytoplasma TaxID=2358428 RepID=UPI001CECF2FD|nr:hypothetical protein ['Fragaria x ananassa' phyllody phytoplasma]